MRCAGCTARECRGFKARVVDASLADGRLSVSHFDVGIAGGHAVGKGVLDTASKPMQADAEVDVSAIRVESLLPTEAAKKNFVSGTVQGRAALKASGDSVETLLAGASGTVSAFVGAGTVSSLLDAKMGLQGGRIVRGLLTGAEPIALRCAAAVLELERGRARIRTLVVDTERTRTIGTGTIDLAKQAVESSSRPRRSSPGCSCSIGRSICTARCAGRTASWSARRARRRDRARLSGRAALIPPPDFRA